MATDALSAPVEATQVKTCPACEESKPINLFGREKGRRDGISPYCLECSRLRSANYYAKNKEICAERTRDWASRNPDKISAAKIRRGPEYNLEYQRAWRAKNRERLRERAREKVAALRSTPKGKLDNAISCGVRFGLAIGSKRRAKWETLVGYSLEELMAHLEALFRPGMTWENYGRGGWHVDHVIPKSIFNYDSPHHEDFKRAWSLSNLQPLWESENCSKSDTFVGVFQPSMAFDPP